MSSKNEFLLRNSVNGMLMSVSPPPVSSESIEITFIQGVFSYSMSISYQQRPPPFGTPNLEVLTFSKQTLLNLPQLGLDNFDITFSNKGNKLRHLRQNNNISENSSLLGCYAESLGLQCPTFRRTVLPPASETPVQDELVIVRNVGNYLPVDTALHPGILESPAASLSEAMSPKHKNFLVKNFVYRSCKLFAAVVFSNTPRT